jgi:hypothetical protein
MLDHMHVSAAITSRASASAVFESRTSVSELLHQSTSAGCYFIRLVIVSIITSCTQGSALILSSAQASAVLTSRADV